MMRSWRLTSSCCSVCAAFLCSPLRSRSILPLQRSIFPQKKQIRRMTEATKVVHMSTTSERRTVKKMKTGGGLVEEMMTTDDSTDSDGGEISYVEFYSGVGGWTMALEEAWNRISSPAARNDDKKKKTTKFRRIAALDNSDLCTKVFEYNFGDSSNNNKKKKTFNIERLSLEQVENWQAQIWMMSPPCQPHTRQHSNQDEDLNDPRSVSFLHLCDLLEGMNESTLPKLLCLENVVGFESSRSKKRWDDVLTTRKYSIGHFHLNPTQVGLPNDRPRHYCVAVLLTPKTESGNNKESSSTLASYLNQQVINTELPELGIAPIIKDDKTTESDPLPTISTFLDNKALSDNNSTLRVPEKILKKNAAWCFDIVTPASQRSSCFTSSYGKFIRGTGSILYDDVNGNFKLLKPEEREFDGDWSASIDISKLRYFSGMELARLMGYSETFSFPSDVPIKQQWKLIGNSLNVRIASFIVELGLRLANIGCCKHTEGG